MKPNIENTNGVAEEEDAESKVHAKCDGGGGGEGGGGNQPQTKPYERKRTANLENLIGNLKVKIFYLHFKKKKKNYNFM